MDTEIDLNQNEGMREFVFPVKRDQMISEPTDNRMYVNDLLNIDEAKNDEKYNFINNLSSAIGKERNIEKVLDCENYDMLYSFVHFSSKCSPTEKASVLDVITRCKYYVH
jgi:predicted transcriptional regulator